VLDEPVFAADGTVYVMSFYQLLALDPATLAVRWSGPSDVWSPVLGADGTLFLPAVLDGNFLALHPDGSTKWSRDLVVKHPPPLVLPDGTLAFATFTPPYTTLSLQVLHGDDGTDAWSVDLGPAQKMGTSATLLASSTGMIYAITNGGIVAVSGQSHAVLWTSTLGYAAAALDEKAHLLYTLAKQTGSAHAIDVGTLDADNGVTTTTFGTLDTSAGCGGCGVSRPTLGASGWVYVVYSNSLYGFQNGPAHATWAAPGFGYPSAPVVGGDGTVYIAEEQTNGVWAHAFAADGTPRWNQHLGTQLPFTSESGAAMSIDAQGRLYALFAVDQTLFQLGP
jgi:hypothetical protein